MTTEFEKTFNLKEIEEVKEAITENPKPIVEEIEKAIEKTENIEKSLESIKGFMDHDIDMDLIALEALKSYKDLMELGLDTDIKFSGPIFQVASVMLRHALDAKDLKVNKKIRVIDLQLRKKRLDWEMNRGNPEQPAMIEGAGIPLNTTELIQKLKDKEKNG